MSRWSAWLPTLPARQWARGYGRDTLTSDGLAALIVTIMLIPQSLAYALLAGLPPQMGIYASIAPIILYAIFGTSRALAVGPVLLRRGGGAGNADWSRASFRRELPSRLR